MKSRGVQNVRESREKWSNFGQLRKKLIKYVFLKKKPFLSQEKKFLRA